MPQPAPVQREVQAPTASDLDDTIARLCHKLRTPLTSAMGFLQLTLRDAHRREQDPAELRNLEMVDQQLRRLAGLIDEVAARPALSEH